MKAGQLDRKITIQRVVTTLSPSGDPIETWSNLAVRRSASMKPFRATETFVVPEKIAYEQVEFRIRYAFEMADLGPLDRVIYPALTDAQAADSNYDIPVRTIYDILGVLEIGRREGLQIVTNRRPDLHENG